MSKKFGSRTRCTGRVWVKCLVRVRRKKKVKLWHDEQIDSKGADGYTMITIHEFIMTTRKDLYSDDFNLEVTLPCQKPNYKKSSTVQNVRAVLASTGIMSELSYENSIRHKEIWRYGMTSHRVCSIVTCNRILKPPFAFMCMT